MPGYEPEKAQKYIGMNQRYCPKCKESLKVVTTGNAVKARSYEKNEVFASENNMKVYQTQFQCQRCRLKFTLDDLRKIENADRKKKS